MLSAKCVVAVDLGGTNLRAALVGEDGVILEREKRSSDARAGSEAVLANVLEAIRTVSAKADSKKQKIAGVSLGFPGIVDPERGVVCQSPHFPDWKDLDVLGFLKRELSWSVLLDNDANLAALGEGWRGAGQGMKNFILLTLGTGVGGGVVLDGRILHGDRGFAGELGHICIETEGPPCACGSRGCLETFVSATGIHRFAEESDQIQGREALLEKLQRPLARVTVQDLYEAALDGDILSNTLFKKMGTYLGIGIASLTNAFGVENFILGGGVAQAWDFFIEPAKEEMARRTYRETAGRVRIHKAALGDDAALVGGAAAFFKK